MAALDPKRLLDLLAIARHGSYTHAASALGVSQPALSNSIAALEKALGVRVLDRTRSGATLTDFGRLLANHAEALQSALSRASGDVALKKDGMEGSLVIGVSPVACVDIVPDAVALLKRTTPNVAVRIHELPDDQLLAQLQTGEIDLMVSPTGFIADLPDIEREVLLRDTFVIIMRPQNPLAKRKALSLRVAPCRMGDAEPAHDYVAADRGLVCRRERAVAGNLRHHQFGHGAQIAGNEKRQRVDLFDASGEARMPGWISQGRAAARRAFLARDLPAPAEKPGPVPADATLRRGFAAGGGGRSDGTAFAKARVPSAPGGRTGK